MLADAEFRTPPNSWGFKAINPEAPVTAGRKRGDALAGSPGGTDVVEGKGVVLVF